jgi:hypothetical protein
MSAMTRVNDPLKSVEAVSTAMAASVPGVGISEACACSRARRVADEGDRALGNPKREKA